MHVQCPESPVLQAFFLTFASARSQLIGLNFLAVALFLPFSHCLWVPGPQALLDS